MKNSDEVWLPLYEAKLIHQNNHRYTSFDKATKRDETRESDQDNLTQADYFIEPWYFVNQEYVNIKISDFSEQIGFNQSTISSAINRNSDVTTKVLVAILNKFKDVNSVWLLLGEGDMFIRSGSVGNMFNIQHTENNGGYINQSVGLADCEKQVVALQAELLAAQKKIIALLEKGT